MSTAAHPLPLGEILVRRGHITRDSLQQHLPQQRGVLGRYLTAHNLVKGRAVAEAMAEQHGLPFLDFTDSPPDPALFSPGALADYCAHDYVPHHMQNGTLTIATTQPCPALYAHLHTAYQHPVRIALTGPYDLAHYFRTIAATHHRRVATLGLRRRFKHLTADRPLLPAQRFTCILLGLIALTLTAAAPEGGWQALIIGCNLFYLASLFVKLMLYQSGHAALRRQRRYEPQLAARAAALSEAQLPIYNILVPLYHEPVHVLSRLIHNLAALDYPREKLDIKLICEADDASTINALKALSPPQYMQLIHVPPGHPRTKPKACNLALQQARGEFLVIYDAEDAPPPDQLRRAVAMFTQSGPHIACLQAALNYENRNENLLTQLFSIEYSALFQLHLPALERLHIPIPLGGTSNHLRVSALRQVGGWDAFNVTEDADLGMRLAYFGYGTRILPSCTMEEAPITLRAWLKQRTRWIKGYIQTWFVYMRDAVALRQHLSTPAYYGFQFFIGAPALTFLIAPFFWCVFAASFAGITPQALSPATQTLCLITFSCGIACNLLYAHSIRRIEQWPGMTRAMLIYPFYWLLHSVAAARAVMELVVKPHYWAKTQHGLSKTMRAA